MLIINSNRKRKHDQWLYGKLRFSFWPFLFLFLTFILFLFIHSSSKTKQTDWLPLFCRIIHMNFQYCFCYIYALIFFFSWLLTVYLRFIPRGLFTFIHLCVPYVLGLCVCVYVFCCCFYCKQSVFVSHFNRYCAYT